MGNGTFWEREQLAPGTPETLLWKSFSAALGRTLFNLPAETYLSLTARELSAQFVRGSAELYCEVVVDAGAGEAAAVAAWLTAQGWDEPDSDAPYNWRRGLPCSAALSDYEQLATLVVAVQREVQRLWLPAELTTETRTVEARQAPSSAVADPLADVYPLLKPGGWPDAAHAPHFTFGSERQRIVVSYAHDRPDSYQAILDGHPEADDERLPDRAMANLAALHYEWQFTELQWLRIAHFSGYDFAAEKLFDPAAMREAHRLLGTGEMIVSVPRRTVLYAFPHSTLDTMESTRQMLRLVERTYADDSHGHAAITPLLFVVRDGTPVSVLDPADQAPTRRHHRAR